MSDYADLIQSLRCCATNKCESCPYEKKYSYRCATPLVMDAAAAIEALQAEIRESMQKCAECGAEPITLEQAIDRLHELGWLQEHDRILSQPHWVSVEQPPVVGQHIMVMDENEDMFTATYDGNGVYEDEYGFFMESILYWMPLPEPPQEVQE